MSPGPQNALSHAELSRIVLAARSLDERLAHMGHRYRGVDQATWRALLDQWARRAARGDRRRFARRAQLLGRPLEQVRDLLGPPVDGDIIDLPAWATSVLQASRWLQQHGARRQPDCNWQSPEVPFVELLAPVVEEQWRELRLQSADSSERRCVQNAACRWLLSQLSDLALPVLAREFTRFRNRTPAPPTGHADPRAAYRRFIAVHAADGLRSLLCRYPVWARLLGTRLHTAARALQTFFDHLHNDRQAFAARFHEGLWHTVYEIQFGCSDPHDGGQTVIRVGFQDAKPLFYKPRGVSGQALLTDLGAWISEPNGPRVMSLPTSLDFEDRSWTANVVHRYCTDSGQWHRFHRQAGKLLCSLYLLDTTDMHADNVIATGDALVPIDTETVLHPYLDGLQPGAATATNEKRSVTRVGLLPRSVADRTGRGYSQAGLSDVRQAPARVWCWRVEAPNTDAMRVTRSVRHHHSGANSPWLPPSPPGDDTSVSIDLVDGFDQAYRALMAFADDRSAELLARARTHRARCVVRPTRLYHQLRGGLQTPDALVDGVRAQLELEALYRPFLDDEDTARRAAPLVRSEIRQLLAGDIPCFYARADSTDLHTHTEERIPSLMSTCALERLERNIARLDNADLYARCAEIHAAYRGPP